MIKMLTTTILIILVVTCHGEKDQTPKAYKPPQAFKYPEDYCQNFDPDEEFDFVVVGAGPAGCAVSRRLAEDPSIKVLLLEAGGNPPSSLDVPGAPGSPDIVWNFKTNKDESICLAQEKKGCPLNSGKVLGGSSAINAMMHVRGNHEDYDNWSKIGCKGWSYQEVLPYFKKMEKYTVYPLEPDYVVKRSKNRKKIASKKYHSTDGPLWHSAFQPDPKTHEFREKVKESQIRNGIKYNVDINGAVQIGVTDLGGSLDELGYRNSAAKAYLNNLPDNLKVCKYSLVMKVILEDKKITGVDFRYNGTGEDKRYRVQAKREYIVSAGPLHSPGLLERSGIGRKEVLEKVGVELLHELKGVGENYQDHLTSAMTYEVDFLSDAALNPFSSGLVPLTSFFNTTNLKSEVPDTQFVFLNYASGQGKAFGYTDEIANDLEEVLKNGRSLIFFMPIHIRQPNPGSIHITQTEDPNIAPDIITNHLTTDLEKERIVKAALLARKIMGGTVLKPFNPKPFVIKPCRKHPLNSKDEILCHMRHLGISMYHHAGVTAMGPPENENSVVDPDLRVIGLENLRIVDSGIMPLVTRGNTEIPTVMIGEKAADIIKKFWNIM